MKIIALSDTHSTYFNNKNIESCDLLFHAGDLQAYNDVSELYAFIEWYNSFDAKYKICIAGNHDKFIYENNNLCKKIFKKNNIIYLENSMVEIESVKIYGSPITPTFMNWYFMAERGKDIKKYWDKIPKCDVLITHGPAYGILDYVSNTYNIDHHAGCEELLKAVKRIKPSHHLFGHIHSSSGTYETKDTTFINASVLDEDYLLEYEPKIIYI